MNIRKMIRVLMVVAIVIGVAWFMLASVYFNCQRDSVFNNKTYPNLCRNATSIIDFIYGKEFF